MNIRRIDRQAMQVELDDGRIFDLTLHEVRALSIAKGHSFHPGNRKPAQRRKKRLPWQQAQVDAHLAKVRAKQEREP